jgi:hypothetical protein
MLDQALHFSCHEGERKQTGGCSEGRQTHWPATQKTTRHRRTKPKNETIMYISKEPNRDSLYRKDLARHLLHRRTWRLSISGHILLIPTADKTTKLFNQDIILNRILDIHPIGHPFRAPVHAASAAATLRLGHPSNSSNKQYPSTYHDDFCSS